MPKPVIVFDCDGTLISSHEAIYLAYQILIKDLAGLDLSRDEIASKWEPDLNRLAKSFEFEKHGITLESFSLKWDQIMRSREFEYALYPEIKSLLQKLQDKNYPLYVWTARDRFSTERILNQLDVLQFFKDMRCADDTIPKPNPAGLNEMLGTRPSLDCEVFVIGDTYADMLGAKHYGARGIGALWGGSDPQTLNETGAVALAQHPMDCLEIIKEG